MLMHRQIFMAKGTLRSCHALWSCGKAAAEAACLSPTSFVRTMHLQRAQKRPCHPYLRASTLAPEGSPTLGRSLLTVRQGHCTHVCLHVSCRFTRKLCSVLPSIWPFWSPSTTRHCQSRRSLVSSCALRGKHRHLSTCLLARSCFALPCSLLRLHESHRSQVGLYVSCCSTKQLCGELLWM